MNLISSPDSTQNRKSNSKISIVVAIALTLVFSTITATSFAASPSAKPKVSAKPTAKATAKAIAKPTAMPSPGADRRGDGGPRGGGFGGAFANLTDANKSCLAKNGFTVPQGGANGMRPSGAPTGVRPTGFPSGAPSGFPTGAPAGGPRMGGGAGFDPTIIAKAFSACGLEAPAFGGPPGAGATVPNATSKAKTPAKPSAAAVSSKQTAFVKCMTSAGIKTAGAALAYDQSDPDTAIALVKCQKSTGFVLPKKK
jgi:hypothetical protein